MLKLNFLQAIRSLKRNKAFTVINITGLAMGLAVTMGVLFYVQDETSYDRFHKNINRIYQVTITNEDNGSREKMLSTPNGIGTMIKEKVPAAEKVCRVFHNNFGDKSFVSNETDNFIEKNLYWADSTLLDVFSVKLLSGNKATVLRTPGKVLLSESAAKKYLGTADAVGKTLRIGKKKMVEVEGVFKDLPANTHLPLQIAGAWKNGWWAENEVLSSNASFETYVLLNKANTPLQLEQQINKAFISSVPKEERWFTMQVKPFADLHLYSTDFSDAESGTFGDAKEVKILMALAFIILLVACINYMNLSTAKAQKSFLEVGVNKALGATKKQLAKRYYTETFLLVSIAMLISLVLLFLSLPLLTSISGKQLDRNFLRQSWFWGGFAATWLIVSLIAGSYPSFFLSSFTPKQVFQQGFYGKGSSSLIRKSLVVVQFAVSVTLIICTVLFYSQLQFMQNKKLGFQPEQVVAISTEALNEQQQTALKTEIQRLNGVSGTALAQGFPGVTVSGRSMRFLQEPDNAARNISTNYCEADIFKTMDIPLLAGTLFTALAKEDTVTKVIINETAMKQLGLTLQNAVGKKIFAQLGTVSEITGVCRDFNFESLHRPIAAYAFHNRPSESLNYLLVKISANNVQAMLDNLKKSYLSVVPAIAFDYEFVNEHLNNLYKTEMRLSGTMLLFGILAVIIACLGLFGLSAYMAEQRIKEIGIRKVLGATTQRIVHLLSKDFLKLVLIAITVASPLAYYFMNKWLHDFAYRINISVWVFLFTAIAAVTIAFITIAYQSIKAALMNPVKSLKAE
jgi:putative ABC transport system permease protein